MSAESEIESPCISVCAMDDISGLCLGCYRTLEEIQGWWDLDNIEKSQIIEKANQRAAEVFER